MQVQLQTQLDSEAMMTHTCLSVCHGVARAWPSFPNTPCASWFPAPPDWPFAVSESSFPRVFPGTLQRTGSLAGHAVHTCRQLNHLRLAAQLGELRTGSECKSGSWHQGRVLDRQVLGSPWQQHMVEALTKAGVHSL